MDSPECQYIMYLYKDRVKNDRILLKFPKGIKKIYVCANFSRQIYEVNLSKKQSGKIQNDL